MSRRRRRSREASEGARARRGERLRARRARRPLAAGLALLAAACGPSDPEPDIPADALPATVRVYTDRGDDALRAVLDAFEDATGVRVEVAVAPAPELLARLGRERRTGAAGAGLLVLDDAAALVAPAARELLASVETDALDEAVPADLRDPDGRWWGVAQRARVLAHRCGDPAVPDSLTTLASLADTAWRGRVLVGAEGPTTVEGLVAEVLARGGEGAAAALAAGLPEALARAPEGDDGAQASALLEGAGDVAVVETRALARALEGTPRRGEVCVRFPDQEGDGTPMTLTAAAVVDAAPSPDLAEPLLEHLVSAEAQETLAWSGHEYPVRPDVAWSPPLLAWGPFRADTAAAAVTAEVRRVAASLLEARDPDGDGDAPTEGDVPSAAEGRATGAPPGAALPALSPAAVPAGAEARGRPARRPRRGRARPRAR